MTDAGPGTALTRAASPLTPDALLPSDDEIRRIYRIAEAMHLSAAFKDIGSAEKAFAKMIIGRDLGLSPAQAMTGVHLVEGGIQMHYATLGQFVRSREGHDFRAGWIKDERTVEVASDEGPTTEAVIVVGERQDPEHGPLTRVRFASGQEATYATGDVGRREVFVWHDEDDPLDAREVTGAAVVFKVDGEQRGVSRFTIEDAKRAQLVKESPKAAWNAARRNMLLARAMSNGVKWFVPEVLNGMPVYAEGELEAAREKPSLTASAAGDDTAGSGIDLGPKVEKIIARATELGHRGLSNRPALEVSLGNRAPGIVDDWLKRAKEELDRFAAEKEKTEEQARDGEPIEEPAEEPVEEDLTTQAAEVVDAGPTSSNPQDHVGHRVVLTRSEGADDALRCEDCDVVLVADNVQTVKGGSPLYDDPAAAVQAAIERDGGTVEQ